MTNVDMKKVFDVFLSQMRLLFGLDNARPVPVLPQQSSELRIWEKEFLYRLRTLENMILSKVTLQALAHLLSKV